MNFSILPKVFIASKLGRDFNREEMMETFPSARTFPQIIFNKEKIGGYTELEQKFK